MFSGMREDVRAVFDRDPAARHWLEVVTTSPGLHAILGPSVVPLAVEQRS